MFPATIQGNVVLPSIGEAEIDRVLDQIEVELKNMKAKYIVREGTKITFAGGMFRSVSNWNILGPVGSGQIEIASGAPGIVTYRFSCLEMLFAFVLFGGFMLLTIGHKDPVSISSLTGPVCLCVVYGINYLIAALRLPNFVKGAVRKAA